MVTMKRSILLSLLILFSINFTMHAQGSPDYKGGFKVKFNDDGSKYMRFISWVQGQAIYDLDAGGNQSATSLKVKRARLLMFSQITDKFLILTHFGINNLSSNSLSPTGKGDGSQIFLHDAWAQYNFSESLSVGTGLHYFNGISRLSNQSTLNMLTLDNNRQSWATLGLTDQFARHIGVFAKGNLGKLQYRIAINDAITNSLDSRDALSNEAVYGGKRVLGSKDSGWSYAGYFEYQIFDKESNFLPFKVGTYLGAKKVFNIGAGFYSHPGGAVIESNGNFVGEDINIVALDAFYEAPVNSDSNAAITAYAVYQSNDYGTNYKYSAYGTGNMFYTHVGYLFSGDSNKGRVQPYLSYQNHGYDVSSDNLDVLGLGLNYYLSGHNSKITLEYKNQKYGASDNGTITLQAMIYL